MSIGNFMCAGAVVATFGVLAMCCAFWFGVAVGRREGAAGVSVEFKQEGEKA